MFSHNEARNNVSCIIRKPDFAYAKTKAQISGGVTMQLISAFVSTTWMVWFLVFLNPKFQASSHFCGCTARFVLDLVGSPRQVFLQWGSILGLLQFAQAQLFLVLILLMYEIMSITIVVHLQLICVQIKYNPCLTSSSCFLFTCFQQKIKLNAKQRNFLLICLSSLR